MKITRLVALAALALLAGCMNASPTEFTFPQVRTDTVPSLEQPDSICYVCRTIG